MENDLSFITNEEGRTLSQRLKTLINDCKAFDCLTGYFYISGFHLIKEELKKAEKIRILVGLGVSPETYTILKQFNEIKTNNEYEELSDKQIKNVFSTAVKNEFEDSEDNKQVEEGIKDFINLIKEGKLEVKVYPERKLHAKVYIVTFKEGDRDIGRVITGSSNLSYSGLVDHLEFNVELTNPRDYKFALKKFNELWKNAVNVTQDLVSVIELETWANNSISPYELYLKFLYEYFVDDLNAERYLKEKFLPSDYIELKFQTQAVLNAKKILQAYGGCFISDVVGLGKTYVTARLIQEIGGRTLVIAPPHLLDFKNPGSWKNVFSDFNIPANYFSIAKLDDALEEIQNRNYDNIVIDESHRFRNETTLSYEKIAQICRGKRVILVTATPFNNKPTDLLNQIALFQNKRRSTIPGIPNLEAFFVKLNNRLKNKDNYDEYLRVVRANAKEIREKCLKYIMIRRTRKEIEQYFSEDLKKNNIKFPMVLPPKPLFYQLDSTLDQIFMSTVKEITKNITYARYKPLLYLRDTTKLSQLEKQSQLNLSGFMKVLLVKRLESSFFAFKQTLKRFIQSYEGFIKAYEHGKVYISKKYMNRIFELLDSDSFDEITKLLEEGKAEEYNAYEFDERLIDDLKKDLETLNKIKSMWDTIDYDPKIDQLIFQIKNNEILKNNKLIIFTESQETASYIADKITEHLGEKPLVFTGESSESIREAVIDNFDAKARGQKDDYRILVSTEVLSEGVNLHRSNVVLNYDIPWNPTRLMQRVGRVNRIDTKFDKIYTFNFFPSAQADREIELTNIARSKIEAFLTLLGSDSAILTEGEPVESHELFDKLTSIETLLGEDEIEESELKYLKVIEKVRDEDPTLFEKIKRLPKKARASKSLKSLNLEKSNVKEIIEPESLITFFRKGRLTKFYLANSSSTFELDFLEAAKIMECSPTEPASKLDVERFYELLAKNKIEFVSTTSEFSEEFVKKRGKDFYQELMKYVKFLQKNSQKLTDKQEQFLKILEERLNEGSIPKKVISRTLEKIRELREDMENPLKLINVLQGSIPKAFLSENFLSTYTENGEKREIILSLYLGR
ncbi:MAG: helicase-related protein [Candidatus Aenigmatarchaeota archaeon]